MQIDWGLMSQWHMHFYDCTLQYHTAFNSDYIVSPVLPPYQTLGILH